MRALRQAGAEVQPETAVGGPDLEVPVRSITVDGESVLTYEYATEDERQAVSDSISSDMKSIAGKAIAWSGPPKVWATGRIIIAYAGSDGGTILLLSSLLGDPLRYGELEIDEPYPPAVTAAIEMLASELSVDPAAVEVTAFDSVNWPNSCLGAPRPGEQCAQAVTPGWQVDLIVDEAQYEAHTDQLGDQVRLK
jgi:hypothetical protein